VFVALTIATFAVSLICGVFLTADSVAAERREGTLGLLFLTELRGHDVVLGKLVGTSIRAFYGLLAVIPVLALPLLGGGVTAGEFWRIVLVILSGLFLSLTIGLVTSVTSREARSAMVLSFLAILMLCGLPWALYSFGCFFFNLNPGQLDWMLSPSPFSAFVNSFSPYFRTLKGPDAFWKSIVFMQGLTLLGLVVASVSIRRVWQDANKTDDKAVAARRRSGLRYGSEARRAEHRSWLTLEPFYWLATQDRGPTFRMWMVFGPCFLIWFGFWLCFVFESRSSEFGFICAFFMGYALHVLFKGFVAAEAGRRLLEDRKSGALELLLVTPLPVPIIISGQQRAMNQMFIVPLVLLFLMNVALVTVALGKHGGHSDTAVLFMLVFLAGTTLLFIDYFALRWVGMWMALNANRHFQAVGGALRRVMMLPWLGFGLFFFIVIAGRGLNQGAVMLMILLWAAGSLIVSLVAGVKAREGMEWKFRQVAASEKGNENIQHSTFNIQRSRNSRNEAN